MFAAPELIDAGVSDATSITSTDIDDDGDSDILIGTSIDTRLYRSDSGGFIPVEIPFSKVVHNASLWGDLENDGDLNLVLCTASGVQIWETKSGVDWTEESVEFEFVCNDGALADFDHDGDLDLLLVGESGLEIFGNNLDGTFRALAAEIGLSSGKPADSIVLADFDSDQDVDLVVG